MEKNLAMNDLIGQQTRDNHKKIRNTKTGVN